MKVQADTDITSAIGCSVQPIVRTKLRVLFLQLVASLPFNFLSNLGHRAGDTPSAVPTAGGVIHSISTLTQRNYRHILRVHRIDPLRFISCSLHHAGSPFPRHPIARKGCKDPRAKPRQIRRNRRSGEILTETAVVARMHRRLRPRWHILPGRVQHGPVVIRPDRRDHLRR